MRHPPLPKKKIKKIGGDGQTRYTVVVCGRTGLEGRNHLSRVVAPCLPVRIRRDPFLGFTLVQPTVEGIQSAGVIAGAKHYIGNTQEGLNGSGSRHTTSSNVDERTEMEICSSPHALRFFAISRDVGLSMDDSTMHAAHTFLHQVQNCPRCTLDPRS